MKIYIKHIYKALTNSLYGLKYAMSEKAFRIELVISSLFLPLSCYYINDKVKLAVLIMSYFIVLITELLNTAIEKTVDRISYKKHILSKKAKDIGSAAVFLSIIKTCLIVFIIFIY